MTLKKILLHNALDDTRKALERLMGAVRTVRGRRNMNAPEPPEMQDAWDRLMLLVLESELVLRDTKPDQLDKTPSKENTPTHLPKRMAHDVRARKAGRGDKPGQH
jgi:hypothetical protein